MVSADVSSPEANTTAAAAQGVVIQEGLHYTRTRLALAVVGCGGLLEWKHPATIVVPAPHAAPEHSVSLRLHTQSSRGERWRLKERAGGRRQVDRATPAGGRGRP